MRRRRGRGTVRMMRRPKAILLTAPLTPRAALFSLSHPSAHRRPKKCCIHGGGGATRLQHGGMAAKDRRPITPPAPWPSPAPSQEARAATKGGGGGLNLPSVIFSPHAATSTRYHPIAASSLGPKLQQQACGSTSWRSRPGNADPLARAPTTRWPPTPAAPCPRSASASSGGQRTPSVS